jgi:hypothetical protein
MEILNVFSGERRAAYRDGAARPRAASTPLQSPAQGFPNTSKRWPGRSRSENFRGGPTFPALFLGVVGPPVTNAPARSQHTETPPQGPFREHIGDGRRRTPGARWRLPALRACHQPHAAMPASSLQVDCGPKHPSGLDSKRLGQAAVGQVRQARRYRLSPAHPESARVVREVDSGRACRRGLGRKKVAASGPRRDSSRRWRSFRSHRGR